MAHMMKISIKEVNDYIEYANNNPNEISDDERLLIDNVVIPTLNRDDIYFDEETYYKCISFCERWYYELFPWQKFRYAFVFMYYKNNKDVVYFKDHFDLMGRGSGKDGYLMPLASFLLTPAYGVRNYNIDIVATSEEQAINTFNVVYNMLEDNKRVFWKKHFYWNKTEIINVHTKSILRYNTSNAKTKDGKQTGMIIFNELHAYEDYKQLNTFSSGLGKIRHSRSWTITTNGNVREGPLDEKINLALQVINGESNYLRMFPFLKRIKNEKEVHIPMKKFLETNEMKDIDVSVWVKANPSLRYLPTLRQEIIDDYLKMMTQPSYKTEYFTKRMNLPMENEETVITSWENILKASFIDIEERVERPTPNLDSRTAVIGIDFASINDFLSAGLLFKVDGEYIWRQKTWICSKSRFFDEIKFPFDNKGEKGFEDFEVVFTDTIDERLMINWVMKQMSKYNVKKLVMDNYKFKLLRKSFEEEGLSRETKENPNGYIQMVRNINSTYAEVAPLIEREFIDNNINIGDSAIMRWSIQNTGMKQLSNGNHTYFKIEPKLRKNDPFMAFVHAMSNVNLLEEQEVYVYI